MVFAIILFMGAVSGAHLNPVVSIAFALRGDFQWRRVPVTSWPRPPGPVLAAAVLHGILGSLGDNGFHRPGAGLYRPAVPGPRDPADPGLVSTILGGASGAQNVGTLSAFAVGAYIILAGLWAGPVSGASMNPARTLGPDLLRGDVTHTWIYVAGPLVGASLAVGIAYILRAPGGGPAGRKAAKVLSHSQERVGASISSLSFGFFSDWIPTTGFGSFGCFQLRRCFALATAMPSRVRPHRPTVQWPCRSERPSGGGQLF